MADFNNLQDAGASQDTDQIAVARGAATLRQTIARIRAAARNGVALLTGATFTGAVRGIAPTAADHLTRRDYVQALAPQVWADIANGTTINPSKIVLHGEGVFCCIRQHNKAATGPDGDPQNWIQISNFRGPWTNAWFPIGSFVTRGGYAWVNTVAVVRGDPAPDAANNVKWLLLGVIPPGVVSYNVNTVIASGNRGWTYRATGAATRLLSLPNASGAGEVPNGWDVVVSNGSTADQTISPNGTDTIGGNAGLTLEAGRAVRLQKVASGAWIITADTKDETGAVAGTVDQTARRAAAAAASRAVSTFGVLTADANTPVPGYEFTGYAGPDSTTGLVGSVAGMQSVPIRGIYTATVRTTAALPDIVEGASYYARLGTTDAPQGPVPLYVIIDDVAYAVGAAVNALFYPIVDFGGFVDGSTYRVQVIFTDGTEWITQSAEEDEPNVVNVAADTAIPDTAFGDTYRVTGNVSRTITLPDPEDVAIGWFVRVANGSPATAHSVAREGAGQSIEGGAGPLALPAGQSITIQKVNTNEWELIADTAKSAAVTGGALSLSTALSEAQKKAWRAHFGSWKLDVTDTSALPAITNFNAPDGVILGQSGNTGTSFVDLDDRATMLTAGTAGDLLLLLGRSWVRVTNIFTGGKPLAAVREIAEANKTKVDRLSVFGSIVANPPGIPDVNFPEFIALHLYNKIDPRTIIEIKVNVNGQPAAVLNTAAALRPFNGFASLEPAPGRPGSGVNVGGALGNEGGVINAALNAAARGNLDDVAAAPQWLVIELEYKFTGTSLANNVVPDAEDRISFGINNNAFDPTRNPAFNTAVTTIANGAGGGRRRSGQRHLDDRQLRRRAESLRGWGG